MPGRLPKIVRDATSALLRVGFQAQCRLLDTDHVGNCSIAVVLIIGEKVNDRTWSAWG